MNAMICLRCKFIRPVIHSKAGIQKNSEDWIPGQARNDGKICNEPFGPGHYDLYV